MGLEMLKITSAALPRRKKTPISEARKIAQIAAQEQNREIATWGNVSKNAAQNDAFIHGELDKRGIRA